MRRREFIAVAAAATLARPGVGLAQQAMPARRIGAFIPFAESDRTQQHYYLSFKDKLRQLGWIEGRTLELIERWGSAASVADFQSTAAELVNQRPDLIFLVSSPALTAMAAATSSIPIVFVGVSDPMGQGLITNLARPGRNLTGFTFFDPEMGGKWLGLLKEMAPRVATVRVVFNPSTAPQANLFLESIAAAAASFGIAAAAAPVHDAAEIEATLGALAREGNGGLFFPSDTFTINHHALVVDLTTRYRLPALYAHDFFAREGGLASYGVDVAAQYAQAAEYVDAIFKGTFVGDLPVQRPTKFELIINLKTAKALGLPIPESVLAGADEVIE
jgi:putative ABC transport system substrate-binding protein